MTYIASIDRLIEDYFVGYHKYTADDAQLYAMLTEPVIPDLARLEACIWLFWQNDLLIPDKSQVCSIKCINNSAE